MQTLGDVLATIEVLADVDQIFARPPWTAESESVVARVAPDGFEYVCSAREAREKLQHFVGDPLAMRVARVIAYGEHLRAERELAARDARTFRVSGRPAGILMDVARPSGAGRYCYIPLRSHRHLEMVEAVAEGSAVECTLPGGTTFVVGSVPEYGVLEVTAVSD